MRLRAIARRVAAVLGAVLLTPFLQAPATKLAEKLHFDSALADSWEPAMRWASDLSQNPWYIFAAGMIAGIAVGLWLDAAFRRRDARLSDRHIQKPAIDFTKSVYEDKTFYLPELLVYLQGPRMELFSKKIFSRCTFKGPGVIFFDGMTSFSGNLHWHNLGAALSLPGGELVNGVVPFRHCTFADCNFENVQPLLMDGQPYDTFVEMAHHVLPPKQIRQPSNLGANLSNQ